MYMKLSSPKKIEQDAENDERFVYFIPIQLRLEMIRDHL